ncbi:uncharacterized protein LOC106664340 isoform X2 [Cimex lectularius]|uniref:Protein kinase domain-containing protein n=1 Tax=Cimex lectularius TaxID=79782 RepID=A0A8I6RHJ6_CIMLE|nr:uncharacterized protein LOC106664340 isoform X2 [Cimex lectularius]
MTRGRKLKKKEARRRELEKREVAKPEHDDKVNHERNVSVSTLFKSEDIVEITNILNIAELDDSNVFLGAVVLGRFHIVKKLLREGYSLEKCAEDGTSPMLWAVKLKLVDMADFLIRRGANVNMTDGEGNNAFLLALQTSSWDQDTFMDFWLKIKDTEINVNHANKLGNTVIHYMVKRQWDTALELVASTSRVNLNTVTCKGVTALMMACSRHQEACISTLLKHKADLWIEDQRGCTALCYAIAYFIQKRLEMPNQPIEKLLKALDQSTPKRSLNAYLQRRFELLHDPPEDNFGNTVSSIIIHVITFATRCIKKGVTAFLEIRVFKLIKDIAEKHMDDGDYILAILGVLSEILRFCDCCMNHIPKDELFTSFYESGFPNTCLRILKRFGASTFSNSHIHTVLLPLFFTCKHPSSKTWIKKNYKTLFYYYKNSTHSTPPYMSLYPNDKHLTLVRKTSGDFKAVLTEFQNNEIVLDDKTKKKKSDVKAASKIPEEKPVKILEPVVKKSEDNEIKRKCSEDNLKRAQIEENNAKVKVIATKTLEQPPLKKANSKLQIKEKTSEEALGPKTSNAKDTSYWSLNSSSELFRDSFSADFGGEVVASTPTIYPNWQEDFKEGCDLFGISEGSPIGQEAIWELKKELGSGDMGDKDHEPDEFNPIVEELDNMFNEIILKYEEIWQKEYDEGYVDANGDTEDYLKLMHVLPDLELYYLSEVTRKWKNLVDQLKVNYREKQKDCKTILEELQEYLGKMFKEVNERYESIMAVKPSIKIEDLKNTQIEEFKLNNVEIVQQDEATPSISTNEDLVSEMSDNSENDDTDRCLSDCTSEDDWLRTDYLLAVANEKNKKIPPPPGFPLQREMEIICRQCRTEREPFFIRTRYGEVLQSLKQIWQDRVRSGYVEDIILPNIYDESKIAEGGNFGVVYLGLDLCSTVPLVVKKVSTKTIVDQIIAASLKNLIKTLIELHSDHLLPYTHFIEIKDQLVLATPLCERNLGEYMFTVKRSARFNLNVACMMIRQIIEGIHFLHGQPTPIVHGNLKPSNILVDAHERLRLSEFGIGTILYQRTQPQIGTVIWWAQETFWYYRNHHKLLVSKLSDIQVCGMIAHYIVTGGIHPYGRFPHEIMHNLEAAQPRLALEHEEIKDLITWMLSHKPHERPMISMVLRHVFLWDKEKRWRFILTCAGVAPENRKLSISVSRFHECLDIYAKQNNVHTRWVKMVECQLIGLVPSKLDYADTISGLLSMLRDTLPSSASWFLSVFPSIPLTLYRLIEHTPWMKHKDFSEFVNFDTRDV